MSWNRWPSSLTQSSEVISPAVPAAAAEFYERSGVSFGVLSDETNGTARAYGIECTPALFLVDGSGTVTSSHDAFEREALNRLSEEIAARLGVTRVTLSEGEAPAFSPGCVVHL